MWTRLKHLGREPAWHYAISSSVAFDAAWQGFSGCNSCVLQSCACFSGCPATDRAQSSQGCPSSAASADHAARINMPVVDNSASNQPFSGLDTSRQKSSIPVSASDLPKHQQGGTDVWVYPSEQQFYNAMKRKVCQHHWNAQRHSDREDLHSKAASESTPLHLAADRGRPSMTCYMHLDEQTAGSLVATSRRSLLLLAGGRWFSCLTLVSTCGFYLRPTLYNRVDPLNVDSCAEQVVTAIPHMCVYCRPGLGSQ